MVIVPADLEWRDGLPWSRQFGDIYFSVDNGLEEKRHVFLAGNRLAERWAGLEPGAHFTIAETGFGTGLNFLAAWQLWRQCRPPEAWLHMVSVELHPLRAEDLRQALALWPELASEAEQLLTQYPALVPGWHRLLFPDAGISLTLLLGPAEALLPELVAGVDAWFLDGFAPDRNPGLWQLDILKHLGRLARPGCTAATYTSAGAVRRALAAQGFQVERVKGYGRKREMLVAEHPPSSPDSQRHRVPRPGRRVLVVGAGIAGVSCARSLALRGWQVVLADQAGGPGSAASGNPAAIIYPKLAPPHLSTWHFQQQGYLWLLQQVRHLPEVWRGDGLLWLLTGNQVREGDKLSGHPWLSLLVERLTADEASALAGVRLAADCLHFPQAGFLDPQALYRHWLDNPRIDCRWHTRITELEKQADGWVARDESDHTAIHSDIVILANALSARRFALTRDLPVYPVRGQIALVPTSPALSQLKKVLSYGGYVTPAFSGHHCLGASFIPNDDDTGIRTEDHEHNRQLLNQFVPALGARLPATDSWRGRASYRTQSRDYLPLVGALSPTPETEGLYLSVGHGSKGFCYAPLAAEILAARLHGEPCPVPNRVLASLDPDRFRQRGLRGALPSASPRQSV